MRAGAVYIAKQTPRIEHVPLYGLQKGQRIAFRSLGYRASGRFRMRGHSNVVCLLAGREAHLLPRLRHVFDVSQQKAGRIYRHCDRKSRPGGKLSAGKGSVLRRKAALGGVFDENPLRLTCRIYPKILSFFGEIRQRHLHCLPENECH